MTVIVAPAGPLRPGPAQGLPGVRSCTGYNPRELVTPEYDGLPVRGRWLGTVGEPPEQAKGALAEHVAAELGAAEDDEDHGELDPG